MSPAKKAPKRTVIDYNMIVASLGKAATHLTNMISRHATVEKLDIYLVGGPVRDILLGKPCADLDFVVATDFVDFALLLQKHYGGLLKWYKPFGTAKWLLDPDAASEFSQGEASKSLHVDFARARSETYPQPAALPRVRRGSIKQDMRRRDFSINALAMQLSPAEKYGQVLDVCGGLRDLREGRIRALHKRSFIDDPTRILRALRFAVRLDFDLDARTADWLSAALPILAEVSGARLRNEIDLILEERRSGEILLRLNELGALRQIHADFRVSPQLAEVLQSAEDHAPPWNAGDAGKRALCWTLLLAGAGEAGARCLARRLDLGRKLRESSAATSRIMANSAQLGDATRRPSTVVPLLDDAPEVAIHAAWLLLCDYHAARKGLEDFMMRWRHSRPHSRGDDLLVLGLPPGPLYKTILKRLRDAWLDGELRTADDERALLTQLLAEIDESDESSERQGSCKDLPADCGA